MHICVLMGRQSDFSEEQMEMYKQMLTGELEFAHMDDVPDPPVGIVVDSAYSSKEFIDLVLEGYGQRIEKGLEEAFMNNDHREYIFDEKVWISEKEEKLQKTQTYKKKNQKHPAFRR